MKTDNNYGSLDQPDAAALPPLRWASEIRGGFLTALGDESLPSEDRCLALVSALIKLREYRERTLGGQIQFADAAWSILLDLYRAALSRGRLSVSDVVVGAGVPATTALRWIEQLTRTGAVDRTPDPSDRRRSFLALSETQFSALDTFFRAIAAPTSVSEARSNRSSIRPSGK